jgi:hypothetical protein
MKLNADADLPRMAGLGPTAWNVDTQKVSMHPPVPGHIEFVTEEMQSHAEHHHIVQRRHPENDIQVSLIPIEINPEDLGYHSHPFHHLMHTHQRDNNHLLTEIKNKHKAHA